MDYRPLRFIAEPVEVHFSQPPRHNKKPPCPDSFTWRGDNYEVIALLTQWQDFSRRGRMQHNMRPSSIKKALRRGSWGVGRYYFQVQVDNGQIFELYYDRAPKDVDDRLGSWTLFRELREEP